MFIIRTLARRWSPWLPRTPVCLAVVLCLSGVGPLAGQNAAPSHPAAAPVTTPAVPPVNPLVPDYAVTPPREWEKRFAEFQFRVLEKNGHLLPYRFYHPTPLEPGKTYPLLLVFHGAGERGTDNRGQFQRFGGVNFWEKFPCFVIAPQCPPKTTSVDNRWVDTGFGDPAHTMKEKPNWQMAMAMDLLAKTMQENPADPTRVYVTGLSMGGFATWEILQRMPGTFAAAVPVCGGADLAFAPQFVGLPLWVFHGAEDDVVKTQRSRDIVAAIKAAGGNPKYTEYPGVGHGAWTPTYANPEMWDWLFAQRKSDNGGPKR